MLNIIHPHPSKDISDKIGGKESYINMTVGNPNFNLPEKLLNSLKATIESNDSTLNKYADSRGFYPLRTAIAERYKIKYNIKLQPNNQILVTNGCAEAIWLTIFTATNIGDEVIIPDPCYMLYEPIIISLGRLPVRSVTSHLNRFELDVDDILKCITPKTKLIIINTPCNPTGTVYTLETLKKLYQIIVEKDIYLMQDEVFDDFIFTGQPHIPIIKFCDNMNNLIVVNSFSKRLGITGWRVGWLVASEKFTAQALKAHTYNCLAVNTLIQKALVEVMNDQEVINTTKSNVSLLEKKLTRFFSSLQEIDGFELDKAPNSGMYLFPNISTLYKKIPNSYQNNSVSESVANFILDKTRVAVVPGTAFGKAGENHIRISITGSEANLLEAIERLNTQLQYV
ncbi:pyridoxal phosphate-dependent aminotransferase [Candidatus Tisiphia endosymbiont of Neophilaenus lineatus]|uniref:pyridoxal phosphate-dependent aminotransferase n=1 Tax=Candidatus Tisiphia endosymbiont of Neophilaenus lineatus TaxID=3139336 RepID=UPI0035CC50E2